MHVLTSVDAGRIRQLLDADTFFWLDLLAPSAEDLEHLRGLLGLHSAAIEDTLEWGQLPRLDDYVDHVLLVFFSAREIGGLVEPVEVHVYVSGGWIFTARRCDTRLDGQHGWLQANDIDDEDQVLYHVLDALADGWDPVIDLLDHRVDEVEAAVLNRPQQHHLRDIYRLKQEVTELQRRAGPQRAGFVPAVDTIHRLDGLARGSREWLRDVEAHLDTITSDLRRLSGDLSGLTETFFNANANRLNRLVSLVAVGSMFFLIWTLVTGFFGQNFGYLVDSIDSKRDLVLFEAGALLLPTVILAAVLWWRRRDWW
ncbi:MAG: CorA family divalent cation transporter [Solirubrobacteraceae bacterium]